MYLWEKPDWPTFIWNEPDVCQQLAQTAREQGRLLGKIEGLGFDLRQEAHLHTLTEDVLKSSEIEGEILPPDQVRSSIARRLGMDVGGLVPIDRHVEGIVEMMLDATHNAQQDLTEARLFAWHAALFPAGHSGMRKIQVGRWRNDYLGPMRVVSGPLGREKVHYQAPPAERIAGEMTKFLRWFKQPGQHDPLLIAGLAHLWFVTLHPFDDGNGRIARAIADMALARAEHTGQRYYSMSSQIRREQKAYYKVLETTQKGGLDVTHWQQWFLSCLLHALEATQQTLTAVLGKARFWEHFAKTPFNERQIKILNKLLEGFEGKLTTSKWAKITGCSQDTAHRDILNLIESGALKKDPGGGRSTHYSLTIEGNGL